MRKRFRAAALLLAVAAMAMLFTGCDKALGGGTLRVGVKTDIANFGLYDEESGRYSGMEVDLAQVLCDELGYGALELVPVTTGNREEKLTNGEIDMMIATVTMTEERREAYAFSAPYYTDHVRIMVEESSMIAGLADLEGCVIGVRENTDHALSLVNYMAEQGMAQPVDGNAFDPETYSGAVTFRVIGTYAAVSDALESGEVDAFLADGSILSGFQDDGRVLLPDELSEQPYGVGMVKGSSLSGRVSELIDRWLEDGTIATLTEKWRI